MLALEMNETSGIADPLAEAMFADARALALADMGLGQSHEKGRLSWAWTLLSTGTAVLGTYHGYRRNVESVGWALAWGVFGTFAPVIALPIMFAQGFGEPKRRK